MQNQQTTQELRTYTDEIFSQQQIISNINRRDLRLIASNMDEDQARFYVTRYYILQNDRIRYNNQVRTLGAKPNLLLSAFSEVTARQEKLLKNVLDDHTIDHPVGSWLRSIRGIGPVIAAGRHGWGRPAVSPVHRTDATVFKPSDCPAPCSQNGQ